MTKRAAANHDELVRKSLSDAEYRAEWDRTRFAHDVAVRIIEYRVNHGVSQTELASRVGMRQPHVARLEGGDHEPSLAMLARISRALEIEFHIDITPGELVLHD